MSFLTKQIQYKQIAHIYMKMQVRSHQSLRNNFILDNYYNNEKEVSVNINHTSQVYPLVQEKEWTQSGLTSL